MALGIIGGVASGKSTISRHLQSQGWELIEADVIAHEVILYPHVAQQIKDRWDLKEIDRKAIAKIVFFNPEELKFLEDLMHPEIRRKLQEKIAECKADVVLDAPTLIRAGWQNQCDHIWFVDCPRDVRLARYMKRTGSQVDLGPDMDARDKLLMLDVGREAADQIINSNVSEEDVIGQVTMCWKRLMEKPWIEMSERILNADQENRIWRGTRG